MRYTQLRTHCFTSSASDPTIRWAIKPDIVARVDPPLLQTFFDTKLNEHPVSGSNYRIWRQANDSITLPCAANLRQTFSGSLIRIGSPVLANPGNSRLATHYFRWSVNQHSIDGERLRQNKRFSLVGSGSLVLQQLTLEDSGVYECAVVDGRSTDRVLSTAGVELIVGQAPELYTASKPILSGRMQTEKNMSCTFSGYPAPLLEWRKNAEPVQNSHYFRVRTFRTPILNASSEAVVTSTATTAATLYHTELSIRSLLPNDAGYFQCFARNRFGSSQFTITLIVEPQYISDYSSGNLYGSSPGPPPPPRNPRILSVSDTQVYLTWLPPSGPTDSEGEFTYQVRIVPLHTTRALTMNTTRLTVLLADLRPDSLYDIEVYTIRLVDSIQSTDCASLHIRTKPKVYRPSAVTHLTAEAGQFQTLNISWLAPAARPHPLSVTEKVAFYLITLFNLNPTDSRSNVAPVSTKNQPIQITVPAKSDSETYYHYMVRDLTPDAFYQVSVQAVTTGNVTGHPAVISSSPRVNSMPPSEPPTHVKVVSIGARTATVLWKPPPLRAQNGELILHRINMSCDDWLRPRQINVFGEQRQLIRGLTPATKYELTVSAATRGGNGPDSPLVTFTTAEREAEVDRRSQQTDAGYIMSGDNAGSAPNMGERSSPSSDRGKLSPHLRAVENLRYIDDEENLLLLWSPPVNSKSLSGSDSLAMEIDHYLIKWGKLYPGPNMAKVAADQSRFLIDNLDADASYLIDVSTVYKNQEIASAMITGRTKSSISRRRLLIPLNLHVASTDADSVMLIWDEPECNEKTTQPGSEVKCLGKERIRSYQVMYRMTGKSPVAEQIQSVDESQESDPAEPDDNWLVTDTETNENELNDFKSTDGSMHIINVTRTWARLDNLLPGRRYSAAVRAVGMGVEPNSDVLYSEWSMTELFETPRRGPEDAPADLQLTNIPTGSGPARIQISWQPPQRPHGQLVSYILYFTLNHSLPISKWSKRKLPANSLNTVLNGLHRGAVYFVHMRARNRHGNGPLSPVRLFRTPDASGQGGGEIPIGRNYPDAYSIPKDLLSFVVPSDQEHTIRDVSVPAASNGTRWLFFGFVLGSIILLIVIVCVLLIQRRRQIHLLASFGRKPMVHLDESENKQERLDSSNKFSSQNRRRRKFLSYDQSTNQDVTLLVSNGEALIASDMPTNVEGKFPTEALTTSVTLSAGAFSVGATMTPKPEGILVHSQPQMQNTTGSWDRDSDSVNFVSVSQHRPEGYGAVVGLTLHDQNRNPTPTRTASGSSNSCAGSTGTPTRIAPNPTYQTHRPPHLNAATEPNPMHSYASMTIGGTHVSPHYMVPNSPPQPISGAPQVPLNGIPIPPYYPMGSLPGTQSVHLPAGRVMFDRRPIAPSQFVYPYAAQALYPGGMAYGGNTGQNPSLASAHHQLIGPALMGANTPRVNASDLMSFTSSDDVRPVMSSSIHNENDNMEFPGSNQTRNICHAQNSSSGDTQHYATVDHDVASRTKRLPVVTSPSRTTVVTGNIRSPKRRPPPSSKSGARPLGSPIAQKHTNNAKEASGQKSKCATNGDQSDRKGDGADTNMNKAFSTEELTQEMANLEGLMKDLSAITREDFNC
ncbi:Netrin receptor dcc [Clonorchis sinensis]|uniref:Netrin receptor dcc n=1 Tax=Clonorchis sinensis TaxID=79923 RepID=A0A8T1LWV4_CLOSI|nr:Netrin receptor dcc [Clonorchis sinensis]